MAAKTDPHLDETQRVYAEYHEARAAWEGSDDLFAKARFDRAQLALRENRRLWREIGEATGNRAEMVAATDNHDGPAPVLVPAQEV
jgi:hypothetical protein